MGVFVGGVGLRWGLSTEHIEIPNVLKFRFPMVWFWNDGSLQ